MLQISSAQVLVWLREVQTLEERGKTVCPLMMQRACQYQAHDCVCDVPKTRAAFFDGPHGATCFDGIDGTCLPRAELPDMAYEETMPKPPPRIHRPRGAWTAAIGCTEPT